MVYKDPTAPIPDRVKDLLSRMTLAEKAAQLGYGSDHGFLCQNQNNATAILEKYPNGVGGTYVRTDAMVEYLD